MISDTTTRPDRRESAAASAEAQKQMRFLLIEDDEDHAFLIEHHLRCSDQRNQVAHVRDGEQALRYLCQADRFRGVSLPDVILLDLNLPKVDGHEVLRQIKRDPRLRSIPIVVLTTSSAEADRVRAYRAHVNSYLVKPLDFREFGELVETLSRYWRDCNQRCHADSKEGGQD